jgi:hypothetical protein
MRESLANGPNQSLAFGSFLSFLDARRLFSFERAELKEESCCWSAAGTRALDQSGNSMECSVLPERERERCITGDYSIWVRK